MTLGKYWMPRQVFRIGTLGFGPNNPINGIRYKNHYHMRYEYGMQHLFWIFWRVRKYETSRI